MGNEAGSRSAQKLEMGVGAAYTALDVLQRSLAEIESRAASLPVRAAESSEDIHNAFEIANQTMLEGARKAAKRGGGDRQARSRSGSSATTRC